jgi:multidrug efflux pump
MVIGVVVLSGVISATLFTLFVVPVAFSVLARRSTLPGAIERRLKREQQNSLGETNQERV